VTIWLMIGLLFAGGVAEHRATFEDANRRFNEATGEEDYLEVAALYQSILDDGLESGVVLFNQGNAFVSAGEFGRALGCYRQALRHRPRDPLLKSNLELVQARVGASPAERGLLDHVVFWRRWLSNSEAAWGVVAIGAVAFLCAVLGLFFGRAPRILAAAATALMLLFLIAFVFDQVEYEWTERGVVVATEAVARKGNAESFAAAFNEPLREGTEFVILERSGDWIHAELPSGLDGWLPAAAVTSW